MIFCVLSFVFLFFIVKYEPPKYLISLGQHTKALESIKAVYDPSEDPDKVYEYLKNTISLKTDSVSYYQALFDPEYCFTTYLMMTCIAFVSFNGMVMFAFYA